ncbi:MAG: alanine dehydrogenase [Saprospiraceae bacterium]|nr:alanine dehydrogenase [Candidatus Brachybacter algidus]
MAIPVFKEEHLTQTETLEHPHKHKNLSIGILKETVPLENRVALVPASVAYLVGNNHKVVVEMGAGTKSHFTDHEYGEAGADIVYSKEEVFKCDVILKVAPPTLDEINYFHPNQILISPLQIPLISSDYINKLRQKRVIALAMEYMKDDDGSFPLVRILSELAGISAILTAADLLTATSGGTGVLLGGISGVPPAKVVILGGGGVAEYATRTAMGLGAGVYVFDNNIYKLMRLQARVGQRLYTSSINPTYLMNALQDADVAIGAVHSKAGRTQLIVSEEMVSKMKPGSVIIDVSIDQGGCFETSEVTTLENPTFEKYGVIHYCVPNIASKVPRTASIAISNIITPILAKAGSAGSIENVLFSHINLRNGVYTYKGCLTNLYLSTRFGIKYTDLDLLITSTF